MKFIPFLLISFSLFAQNESLWKDHFSYNEVRDVLEVNGILYSASENGIFTYDPITGEVGKLSKVNGLNEVDITSIAYNSDNDLILVAYERGELDLISPDEVFNFLEIPLDDFTGSKRINHLTSEDNKMLISTDFGVVTFDLVDLEFDETSFFFNAGSFLKVNESAILNGIIFSGTEQGIYTHPLDDFIANFPNWQRPAPLPTTNFTLLETFMGNVLAYTGTTLWRFDGTDWSTVGNFSGLIDLNANGNRLTLTSATNVIVLDESFTQVGNYTSSDALNGSIFAAGQIYAGSRQKGLINSNTLEEIKPDGPFNNRAWGVTAENSEIWIAPGGSRFFNEPLGIRDGLFYYDGAKWKHLRSEDLNDARDFVHVTIDPNNPNTAYASTWSNNDGLFKIVDGVLEIEYDIDNSPFESVARIGGSVFDDQGNLWAVQSFVLSQSLSNGLIRFGADGSQEYVSLLNVDIGSAGVNPPLFSSNYILVPATRGDGVQLLNTVSRDLYSINSNVGEGSLPSNNVISLSYDNSNRLWIGTAQGLRILDDPFQSVESGSFDTEPVVIVQNNIPEELFIETQINSIVTDAANRKWIGLASGGVFYLSEDGTEIIANFTRSNSPLPSNIIYNIDIDDTTGEVFFATDAGVVSFQGNVVNTGNNFGEVNVFPNPVRPGYSGQVTITGVPNNSMVKITDVVGNLIFETRAQGGIAQWDTRNFNGQLVASGVYLILMTNFDGTDSKFAKVAIVR